MTNDTENQKVINFNDYQKAIAEQEQEAQHTSAQAEFQEIEEETTENETGSDIDAELNAHKAGEHWIPEPLVDYQNKQRFAAAILAAVAIVGAIALKSLAPLILLIGTGYYIYNSFMIAKKYHTGIILERVAICSGVRAATIKERVMVTFREELDDGHFSYHKFFVPGKNAEDNFIVNAPYVIYYDKANPNALLGSIVI